MTIGRDKDGNLSLLYLGKDSQAAVDAMNNVPEGIVEVEVYRKPLHFKRRYVEAPVQDEKSNLEQSDVKNPDEQSKAAQDKAAKKAAAEAKAAAKKAAAEAAK